MRINVYNEEITGEVQVIEKTAWDTGVKFTGVRLFLASPDSLHNEPDDDDRSAITFWFPSNNRETREAVQHMFASMYDGCDGVLVPIVQASVGVTPHGD